MNGIGQGRVLTGLAGRGVLQSRTPWMHEQEADAQGFRLLYALFDFTDRNWSDDALPELLAATQKVGFAGLNVTLPYKQAVLPWLDDLSDAARGVGAVNTVQFADGRRIGHNTDVTAFAGNFRAHLGTAAGQRVLQFGCGGAGAATAYALLASLDVDEVMLVDRDAGRASELAARLASQWGAQRIRVVDDVAEAARRADGVVNATPMGMDKFPGMPLPKAALEPRHWVAEIVYFPLETELLAHARRIGCRTLDGSGMAVLQAAEAFEIFTGRPAETQRMADSFARFVARKAQEAA